MKREISSRTWATTVIVGLLLLALIGDYAYVEWRVKKVESVRIGATEVDVVAIMGRPEVTTAEPFFSHCGSGSQKCYKWSVHGNYQYVCYGRDGRVTCKGSYAIWV
jgi:hypothetical protein